MVINAKFKSVCPKCNRPIYQGDRVVWNKGQKAICLECSDSGSAGTAQKMLNGRESAWLSVKDTQKLEGLLQDEGNRKDDRFVYSFGNSKFEYTFVISPKNGCGCLKIKIDHNKANQERKKEIILKIETLKQEQEELLNVIAEYEKDNQPQYEVYFRMANRRLLETKQELNYLESL